MSFVYVLLNPAMPGLVKIGFTNTDVPSRARDLSSATGVPVPFFVEFIKDEPAAACLEEAVHAELAAYRVNPNREFFRVSASVAIEAINRIAASEEFWMSAMTYWWNRGKPEWRERWLADATDRPVFDNTRAA